MDRAKIPGGPDFDPSLYLPSLVMGETVIGYMDVEYVRPQQTTESMDDLCTPHNLVRFMYVTVSACSYCNLPICFSDESSFRLSEDLSEDAFCVLLRHNLGKSRSPIALQTLLTSRRVAEERLTDLASTRDADIKAVLEQQRATLTSALQLRVSKAVFSRFRYGPPLQVRLSTRLTVPSSNLDSKAVFEPSSELTETELECTSHFVSVSVRFV